MVVRMHQTIQIAHQYVKEQSSPSHAAHCKVPIRPNERIWVALSRRNASRDVGHPVTKGPSMKTNNLVAAFSLALRATIALPAGAQEVCSIRSAAATSCLQGQDQSRCSSRRVTW
jgi:hypothetical protein